ncbi:MAG: class I SAM-dependent methyltransferase [bacterium]
MNSFNKKSKNKLLYFLQKFYWNLHSRTWDNYLVTTNYASEIENIVNFICSKNLTPSAKLLDIGCATGNYSVAFANKNFDVNGVDYSPSMINKAKIKAAKLLVNNIQFLVADLNYPLPFPNYEFNIVIAAHILHGVPNLSFCIDEINRVLKQDGFLCLVVKNKKTKNKVISNNSKSLIDNILKFVKPFIFNKYKHWNINSLNLLEQVKLKHFAIYAQTETENNTVIILQKI